MSNCNVELYISSDDIQEQVRILAQSIFERFQDSEDEIVILGLFKGAIIFLADLCRQLPMGLRIDYMKVSSYHSGTKSTGDVRILQDLSEDIEGKHVIVVEDIIDTGQTLDCVLKILQSRQPHSISVCTLLDKPSRREVDIKVDWVGFEIEDDFVVGYGLDYEQQYRHLPFIGKLVFES